MLNPDFAKKCKLEGHSLAPKMIWGWELWDGINLELK
jgi:hypothetical protein